MEWNDMLNEINYGGESELSSNNLRNKVYKSYFELAQTNPKLARAKADCHLRTALFEKRKAKEV